MDSKVRQELTRDLLHSGFLLVVPEMEGKSSAVRHFSGPNMCMDKRYAVVVTVKVEAVRE